MTRYHKRFTVVFVSQVMGVAVGSYAKDFHLKSQAQAYIGQLKTVLKAAYIDTYIKTNGREHRAQ